MVSILKENTSSGSLIITFHDELTVDLLQSMLDSKSLFRALFEVNDGLNNELPLFGQLKQVHSGQIIELTDIEFEELEAIADNAFFEKDYVNDKERLDLLNFLYYWLYCRKARVASVGSTGIFKNADETVTRKQLFDFLSGDNENSIRERITQLRRGYTDDVSLASILGKQFGNKSKLRDPGDSRIKLQAPWLLLLESMEYPISQTNSDYSKLFNIISPSEAEWDDMRLRIRMPRQVLPNERKLRFIGNFCGALKKASNDGDDCTVRRVANALMYCAKTLFTEGEDSTLDDLWFYVKISKAFYSDYCTLRRVVAFEPVNLTEHGLLVRRASTDALIMEFNLYKGTLETLDEQLGNIFRSHNIDHSQIQNIIKNAKNAMKEYIDSVAIDISAASAMENQSEEENTDGEQKPESSAYEGLNYEMSPEEAKAQLLADANRLV
jgi:hypothetical protein